MGELRRIIPSCQLSVSRRGREGANWFVAQNSRWGIESWKMTAGKLLRNQAHLHLPSLSFSGIKGDPRQVVLAPGHTETVG